MIEKMIAKRLPITPRPGMDEVARGRPELGPEFCTYKRVSKAVAACSFDVGWPLEEEDDAPSGWAAECRCGVCGETWYSGYRRERGISMIVRDDGLPYTGVPEDDDYPDVIPIDEGELLDCPLCGEQTTLIKASALKNGRMYRLRIGSVENAGEYTAVLSWMAERYIASDGSGIFGVYPEYAAVITARGLAFYHFTDGAWTRRVSDVDPFQLFYQTHGGVPNRTVGAWLWGDVPDQTGQTGEKTGIAEYFNGDGQWPVMYLRFWWAYPAIENIVKAGWLEPFEDAVNNEVLTTLQTMLNYGDRKRLFAPKDCLSLFADFEAFKPHEMLGMTREEVREGRRWHWSAAKLGLWAGMVISGIAEPGDAAAYNGYLKRYGIGNMQRWADDATELRLPSMEKLDRYLDRQCKRSARGPMTLMGYYLDYRDMLDELDPTPEQEFPPHLEAAHDRVAAMQYAKEHGELRVEFMSVRETWRDLEWSDGAICAVLPQCSGDLKDEGNKLCHCVGGYSQKHLNGSLIVFIRHARRPERSWYTLNIDVSGKNWHEVQLHGYGNEYAHGKRLHIPEEVRAFVDRWEAEVLQPVFARIKIEEKKAGMAAKTERRVAG